VADAEKPEGGGCYFAAIACSPTDERHRECAWQARVPGRDHSLRRNVRAQQTDRGIPHLPCIFNELQYIQGFRGFASALFIWCYFNRLQDVAGSFLALFSFVPEVLICFQQLLGFVPEKRDSSDDVALRCCRAQCLSIMRGSFAAVGVRLSRNPLISSSWSVVYHYGLGMSSSVSTLLPVAVPASFPGWAARQPGGASNPARSTLQTFRPCRPLSSSVTMPAVLGVESPAGAQEAAVASPATRLR
jgi:hypothetical protein